MVGDDVVPDAGVNGDRDAVNVASGVSNIPTPTKDNYRDPNMLPDMAALQRNVDLTRDLGFIKASFDVNKFADLSIVQEAARRLK